MRFHQRPLQERLRALASGYLAEYRSFATLPVTIYLGDYPVELEQLAELIRYPLKSMGELTCKDAADRIRDMRRLGVPTAGEAVAIMVRPLMNL